MDGIIGDCPAPKFFLSSCNIRSVLQDSKGSNNKSDETSSWLGDGSIAGVLELASGGWGFDSCVSSDWASVGWAVWLCLSVSSRSACNGRGVTRWGADSWGVINWSVASRNIVGRNIAGRCVDSGSVDSWSILTWCWNSRGVDRWGVWLRSWSDLGLSRAGVWASVRLLVAIDRRRGWLDRRGADWLGDGAWAVGDGQVLILAGNVGLVVVDKGCWVWAVCGELGDGFGDPEGSLVVVRVVSEAGSKLSRALQQC